MRLVVFQTSRLFELFAAGMLVVAVSGPAAFAGTIKLKATSGQVGLACIDAGGTYTQGTGTGGYGCKTAKGEVSCDKDGNCTGTCGNCQQRVVVSGGGRLQGGLGQVLANKFAKSPTTDAGKPVRGPAAGILDSRPDLSQPGPAATGSPSGGGAPAAPPGKLY